MTRNNWDVTAVETVNQLIRTRRSVFPDQFEPGVAAPDEWIEQILENANWAPNHRRTEPWRFTVFSGAGLKGFAHFQATRYQETSGGKFRQDKYDKLLTTAPNCSHVIAIIVRRSTTVDIPEVEEIAAVACAVENIWLSLAGYGLGGYWSSGGVTYDPAARDFLALEEKDLLLGFFYIGVVKLPSPGGTRRPVADKTRWVRE